jgi:hypothetical protein
MATEQLTNWEVFDWLQRKRVVRELTTKAAPPPPQQLTSLVSPALTARVRELKWVDTKVLKFLSTTPAPLQSADAVTELLDVVASKTAEWGISLTQKQRLQLVNSQPCSALDLFLCLDDCPELDELRQGELAAAIARAVESTKQAAATAASAKAAMAAKTEVGKKRERANSSASLALPEASSGPVHTTGELGCKSTLAVAGDSRGAGTSTKRKR